MLPLLKSRLGESLRAVAPLVIVVCVLQALFVEASAAVFLQFLAGSALVVVGMLFLLAGIDLGVLPMGRYIGAELPKKGSVWLVLSVAFALGFATTVAEPDVLVLARQVAAVSEGGMGGWRLVYAIAAGVGFFTALGFLRVVRGFSMRVLVTGVYAVVIALSFVAPAEVAPLAYDAGSVTTGVLTTPVVLALALGVSSVLAKSSAVSDGFGLLGMASAGPILVVLLLGLLR